MSQNMCEDPSRSSAAALREARRRKILENSAKRLKLIEGLNSSSGKNPPEILSEPKSESQVWNTRTLNFDKPEPELISNLSDLHNSNKELKEISDFLLQDKGRVFEDEAGYEEKGEEEERVEHTVVDCLNENEFLNIFIQKRLHYVLLALVVNLLLFFNAGYLFFENIFCPFYSTKIIEFITNKEDKQVLPPLLFLLVVGLPKSIQKFTKITLSLLIVLLSDLCIYLFTFIIVMKIINQ